MIPSLVSEAPGEVLHKPQSINQSINYFIVRLKVDQLPT